MQNKQYHIKSKWDIIFRSRPPIRFWDFLCLWSEWNLHLFVAFSAKLYFPQLLSFGFYGRYNLEVIDWLSLHQQTASGDAAEVPGSALPELGSVPPHALTDNVVAICRLRQRSAWDGVPIWEPNVIWMLKLTRYVNWQSDAWAIPNSLKSSESPQAFLTFTKHNDVCRWAQNIKFWSVKIWLNALL